MSYIGIIGAKRLDDSDASSGLVEAQKKAVQLLRCSTEMHMIKQQTGWEMGVDGKWRYEVADPFHNTVEIEDHLKRHFGESINIINPLSYGMMISMGTLNSPFQYQTEGVLLHEVQHLIQEEEDFARGGNLSQGRRRYLRMAGEVEARNVCIRHSMSSEQRRSSLRTDTQDVPDAEQIIVFC